MKVPQPRPFPEENSFSQGRIHLFVFFVLTSLLFAACGGQTQSPESLVAAQPTAENPPATSTSVPQSPTPIPPTATPAPTAIATQTVTPSPTPPHPLSIEYLRALSYPGSEVVIEEQLADGPDYHRYIASYRSEGLKIFALLTVPFGQRPETGWPVVIFNHGYIPPDQYRTTERYVAYVDGFARSGYIVFRSDYRGHGSSEGEPRGAYGSPDYVIDVLNAVAAMKNFPEADPDRIGMWGHSMGGYITLRSMVATSDIKAGVIWAGVVGSYQDLFDRWRLGSGQIAEDPPFWIQRYREILFNTLGTDKPDQAFLDSISANAYLTDLSGPVQLHHGTNDTSVPVSLSQTLNEEIQAVGGNVEYYEYEGDDHNLSTFFTQAMLRSISFFDQYVKGP
jgi:fermentation-respiration switch protein FrsA (DUF1100 family)